MWRVAFSPGVPRQILKRWVDISFLKQLLKCVAWHAVTRSGHEVAPKPTTKSDGSLGFSWMRQHVEVIEAIESGTRDLVIFYESQDSALLTVYFSVSECDAEIELPATW